MREYATVMGGYPGLREVVILEGLPDPLVSFLRDAVQEDQDFLEEYLVPMLGKDDAAAEILFDLCDALCDYEIDTKGLGEIGHLGKSVFRKIHKAVQKVHQAIEKKIVPKPLRKIEEKMKKVEQKVTKSVKKAGKKIWVKYGGIILEIVGAVLALVFPPAGALILAAASVLATANQMYLKKRAAQRAKQVAHKDAAQMEVAAAQADVETQKQVDKFYQDNQSWFLGYGITPDKWAKLDLDHKIGIIQAASDGKLPPGAVQVSSPDAGAAAAVPASGAPPGPVPGPGGGFIMQPEVMERPSGGRFYQSTGGAPMPRDGGAGVDWGSLTPYGGGAGRPGGGGGDGQPNAPGQISQAGMFGDGGGILLPAALVAGAVLLSGSGKKGGGGGRRKRRNPRRHSR